MRTRKKLKRKYLIYLEHGISALLSGIDRFNSVHDPYRVEESLILITNAWELLGKAVLLKKKISINYKDGRSISAEDAITKLVTLSLFEEDKSLDIQQIISLRNAAIHSVLPRVPEEILFHLEFYAVKFFKDIVEVQFPAYTKHCNRNFLALSFDTLTTYADKVQKLISKARKKGSQEQELVWLLERGIRFSGGKYISQNLFEEEVRKLGSKKKLYPHLKISDFVKNTEMVVIVPVQAPKGYTADISLRKGPKKGAGGSALPVMIKKTEIEDDYPFLTNEIAKKIGKTTPFVARAINDLGLKDNPMYYQGVRSSKSGKINRYSQRTVIFLQETLKAKPDYNPYRK